MAKKGKAFLDIDEFYNRIGSNLSPEENLLNNQSSETALNSRKFEEQVFRQRAGRTGVATDVGDFVSDKSTFNEGMQYSDIISPGGVAQYRHKKQPWYASLGSAVNQAVTGQLVGGTIEGVGYLLDLEQYANLAKGTEQEFGNWFSDLGKELRTWSEEATPIYTDPTKQGGWNPEDWTWWMSNLPSVASTMSLMIPSGAVVKGASLLARGLNLSSKLGKTAKWATKGLSQAVVSRHMESMMESSQLMPEMVQELTGKQIGSLEAEKIAKNYDVSLPVIGQDEQGNNLYEIDEDTANEIGAKAAADSYRANWAMLIQDIPQYLLLQTPFGKSTEKLTIGLAKKLGKDVAPVIANKATAIGADMVGEAGEEAYQYVVGERSREMALASAGLEEERDLSDAIKEYTQQGDFWTSATFGALGAGFMQTAGRKLMDSASRVAGLESDRDARIRDVDSWGKQMQMYRGLKQAAENEGDPNLDEQANQFGATNMAIRMASQGNLDYGIEAIEQAANLTEEEQNFLGITPQDVAYMKEKNPNLINDMKRAGELYEKNKNRYSPEFAGLITREELDKEFYTKRDSEIDERYQDAINDIPYFDKLSPNGQQIFTNEQIVIPEVETALNELKNRQNEPMDSDRKELTKTRIEELESFIKDTKEETARLKNERTQEEAASDNKLDLESPSLNDAKKSYRNKTFNKINIDNATEMANKMRTFKWQDSARKKAKKVQKERAKNIVDKVETPQEATELKEEAKGTNVQDLIGDAIQNKATDQLADTEEGEVVFESEYTPEESTGFTSEEEIRDAWQKELDNVPSSSEMASPIVGQAKNAINIKYENILREFKQKEASTPVMITQDMKQQLADLGYSREDISAMKPEDANTIISQNKTKSGAISEPGVSVSDITKSARKPSNFAKNRYSNKPHLWSEESDGLTDHLDSFISKNQDNLTSEEQQLLNKFQPSSPEMLDTWFDKVAKSENASNLSESVKEYYSNQKAKADAIKTNRDPKNNVNYKESSVDPNQQTDESSIKDKKADIERRRQSAINDLYSPLNDNGEPAPHVQVDYIKNDKGITKTWFSKKNAIADINSGKYDDQLLLTEQPTEVQPEPIGTSEDLINIASAPSRSNKKIFSFGGDYQRGGRNDGRNFIGVNAVPVVDKQGLNQGEYKPGTTLYFELDTKDPFSEKSVEEKGIQIVVYKNDDPSVKTPANRKVVGLIPAAKGQFAELMYLRELLSKDLESKRQSNRRYITSKYTSQISGYITSFSRGEQRNSPLQVLRKKDKNRTEYSKFGGYVIGITEQTASGVRWVAPRSGIDSIEGVDTKYPGQIIIGTHNPLIGDTLLLRAFVRKLSNYENESDTFRNNGQKIRQNVIDILKDVKANSNESTMVDINNRIKQYLIGNVTLDRNNNQLILDNYYKVSLDDIQNDNLDVVNEWLGGLIFNIDKNKINEVMAGEHDFGFGATNGRYNELVNDFLTMNTIPGQYYDNTSILVDQSVVENEEFNDTQERVGKAVNELISEPKPQQPIRGNVKEGVGTIFRDNPELADAVYDAVGFKNTQQPKGTINVYWGQAESTTSTKILSNLAPRRFTWEGREYGSVEHAYQANKSGTFDKATYDKYVKIGGYGKKIRGKGTVAQMKAADSLGLMEKLVVESFKQNSNSESAKKLLQYENFTHNTNQLIDKAFLEGLKLAQKELSGNDQITPEQKLEARQKFQEYVETTGRQDIEGFKEFVEQGKRQIKPSVKESISDSIATQDTVEQREKTVNQPTSNLNIETGRYVKYKGETYIVTKRNNNGTIQIYNPTLEGTSAKKSVAERNLETLNSSAVIIPYKNSSYIVTPKDTIISLTSNKIMKWAEDNGDRRNILSIANNKRSQAVPQPTSKEAQVKPDKPKQFKRRNNPLSGAGKSSLMDEVRRNQNKPKTRLVDPNIPYTKWNKAEEIAWFKKNFPQVPITVLDNLKEIVGGGREAWGVFDKAAVYIAKNAATGTAYHEAFHVAFNLFLNDKQRAQVLGGKYTEEQLADEFSEYVASQQADITLGKQVNDFFKKLWLTIKSFFTNNIKGKDEMFFRINTGFYKNAKIDYGSFGANIQRTKIADWPSSYTKDIVESINKHILLDIIPNLRETNINLADLSDVEVMSELSREYGPVGIYDIAYNNLLDIYENENTSDDVKNELAEVLTYFYDENGNPGSIIHESIRAFDTNNGIRISLNKVVDVPETGREEESVEGEEASQVENWQSSYTERSRKTNTPYEVKKFLRYIPSDKPANAIGLNRYVDYEDLYNTLLQDLADSTSLDMMKQYLKDAAYFNPEYNIILDKLNGDSQFGAKFFNAFHNTHQKYLMVLKRKDNYVVTEANKKGVVNNIITKWKNNVLVNSQVLTNKGKGEYTINTDKASEIKTRFDEILKARKLTSEHIVQISDITEELGFKIEPKVFQYALDNNYLRKVLNGDKSLAKVINKFAQGKNPFDEAAGLESEIASIRTLATLAKKATPSLFESSFRNISGKTVYSHLVPNYLSKLVSNLQDPNKVLNVVNNYLRDPLFQSNPILQTMGNLQTEPQQLSEAFQVHVVDGLVEGSERTDYPNMSEADYQVMSLNGYFNNGNKQYSFYRAPVLSDAPNMIMTRFKRYQKSEIVNYLLSLAEGEYRRIKALQEYQGDNYNNYSDKINSSTESGYHAMPMFNGFKGSPKANPEKAKQLIENYLNDKVDKYKESLIANKVILQDINGNVDYTNSRIDSRVSSKGLDSFLEEFYYNDYLMRASFGLLTIGDPAFYKGGKGTGNRMVDYIKRAKEIYSPKYIPDTSAYYIDPETGEDIKVGTTYNTVYLKDQKIPAPNLEAIKKALQQSKDSGYITEDQRKAIIASYNEVNVTDAQAYITLPMYRKTMIGLGRWNDQLQSAYKRLEQGLGTANDIALVMQPIKPFMYTQVYDENLKRMVPVQHKNSEFLLLPQLVDNHLTLKKLHDFMLSNDVGVANFESAVKTGLTKVTTIDKLSSKSLIQMNTADRGIQQEVPEHFRDSNNLFGSQIRKLIMSDLVEGVDYVITKDGEQVISKKAEELRKIYEDIILQDLIEGYESASSELTDESGNISWKKVYNILLDEARNRGKGEHYELAITYDEVNDRLNLPLFHPLYANVSQQLLTSIFKSRVTKQKIAGGSFVQATSFGLSEELKLVKNEQGGLDHAEVLLPAWSKEFYKDFVDSNGNINFEQVKESAPELLDMVGYRIPTEDKYSMLPLKVVGFLPLESGGAIMLPAEITTISGSDFDVDKLYIMMKSFKRTDFKRKDFRNDIKDHAKDNDQFKDVDLSNNNLDIVIDQIINQDQVINEEDLPIYDFYEANKDKYNIKYEVDKYDLEKPWSDQSKGARDNAKIDIMLGVLRNPATLPSILTPGGFDYLKDLAGLFRSKMTSEGQELDVYDTMSNDVMAKRNMTGKQLTGVAANHNAHHALRQNANLTLKQPVKFDNQYQTSISQKKANTQYRVEGKKLVNVSNPDRLITKNFAEFLAAIVDNAKDPVAGDIGYTLETADMMALIVATGYDIATASSFVKQPVVQHIQNRIATEDISEDSVIKDVANSLNVDLNADTPNLNTQEMFAAVGSTDINTELQSNVLIAYNSYKASAKALGKLIQATQADTKPLGPTLADSEVMLNARADIRDEQFLIDGVEEFVTENDTDTNLETYFNRYGIELPLETILNQMFPYRNEFFDSIKQEIRAKNKFNRLSAKQLNTINDNIITYTISGFDFFDISKAQDIIMDLPLRVFKTIDNNSDLQDNALLKRLRYEAADNDNPTDRLVFDNTGSFTDSQRNDVQNAWLDLLNSTDESLNKLGLDLIKYSYFTAGLSFGPNGFSHLVPTEAYLSVIRDSNGNTLSDYLYNRIGPGMYDYGDQTNFIEQFYRNMYRNAAFVPRVKDDFSNVSTRNTQGKRIIGFTVNPDTVKSDDFVIKEMDRKEPVKFIAHEQDGEYNLYKFVGKSEHGFEYELTDKLGIHNHVVEYNINMTVPETLFSQNKIKQYSMTKANRSSVSTTEQVQGKDITNMLLQNNITKEDINNIPDCI